MAYHASDETTRISIFGHDDFERKSWVFTGKAKGRSYSLHIEEDGDTGHVCRIIGYLDSGCVYTVVEQHFKISQQWHGQHSETLQSLRSIMRRYL